MPSRKDIRMGRNRSSGGRTSSDGRASAGSGAQPAGVAALAQPAVVRIEWDGPAPRPSDAAWGAAAEALTRAGFPEATSTRSPGVRSYARALAEAYETWRLAEEARQPLLDEKNRAQRLYGVDSRQFRRADRSEYTSRASTQSREARRVVARLREEAPRFLPDRTAGDRDRFVQAIDRAVGG